MKIWHIWERNRSFCWSWHVSWVYYVILKHIESDIEDIDGDIVEMAIL
jgi:hypothetical protein